MTSFTLYPQDLQPALHQWDIDAPIKIFDGPLDHCYMLGFYKYSFLKVILTQFLNKIYFQLQKEVTCNIHIPVTFLRIHKPFQTSKFMTMASWIKVINSISSASFKAVIIKFPTEQQFSLKLKLITKSQSKHYLQFNLKF